MREDLLGYLLGALEPDEMRRVADLLRHDKQAQMELERLSKLLQPLDDATASEEQHADQLPPLDLISKTLAKIPFAHDAGCSPDTELLTGQPMSNSVALRPVDEPHNGSAFSVRDWFFSCSSAVVLLAVILPTVLEGRFEARRRACQDNLRELGVAMSQFVIRNAEARLPSVHADGHLSFAGVYSPHLREAGLIDGVELTHCPSWQPEQFWIAQGMQSEETDSMLVTLDMLDQAAMHVRPNQNESVGKWVDRLQRLQQTAGGHYAYTLGVRDDGYYGAPRYQGRSSFAVMSDAAVFRHDGNINVENAVASRVLSHDGRGINVLYEDGRVRFISTHSISRIPDHPWLNQAGQSEAGLTVDDAVLGPSWQPPFMDASQR